MSQNDPLNIAPSELGTKSYWDSRYELELNNFQECGDEGEIWFGRSAENRMIDFVRKNVPMSAHILDLGCGNGSVLRRLRKFGYSRLTGVDYCPAAIELSKRISEEEVEDEAGTRIEFECSITMQFQVLDVLSSSREPFSVRFNVVLDKGTWDAMSLSADREQRLVAYRTTVDEALENGGKFVIFSCNFTRDELVQMFDDGARIVFHSEIPAAHTISFGGRQGVTSTGVVFEKK
ncbi:hypothetical protein Q1695_008492 [Nippostrongylus brasiliensis]|nr:hypothetical protein Q1695_008492 [Nippostrongylus brasiliensis]